MSIRRSTNRPNDHYTIVRNDFARDARLSFKARGVALYILSHAAGFECTATSIAKANNCGPDQVYGALRELEEHGYLTRHRARSDDGRMVGGVDYEITDQPCSEATETGISPTGLSPNGKTPTGRTRVHKKTKGLEDQEPPEEEQPQEEKPSYDADASTSSDFPPDALFGDQPLDVKAGVELPKTGHGSKRGTRASRSNIPQDDLDVLFEEFWDIYAHKIDVGHARKAWTKACQTTDPREIINAAARYAQGRDPRFVAKGSTWLNGERWLDEPGYVRNGSSPNGDGRGNGQVGGGVRGFTSPVDQSVYDETW